MFSSSLFFFVEPRLVADDDVDHCWAGDLRLHAGIARASPQAQEKAISPEAPGQGITFGGGEEEAEGGWSQNV